MPTSSRPLRLAAPLTPAATSFATRGGQTYGRNRGTGGPWRRLPLPLCLAGRVASISLDDEMIAVDRAGRVFTRGKAPGAPS